MSGGAASRVTNSAARTILITGGTDGLGARLVHWHQRNGDQVIAVGTRAERDTPPHFQIHPPVRYIQCDLSHIDADQAIAAELRSVAPSGLHAVYLNAARGYWGRFEQQPLDKMEELLRLAFLSPILLLRAIDDLIVSKGEVKIISSVVRYLPQKDYALYAAAKAAISTAVRSLIFEHSARYRVTLLHPGAIATGFHRKSGMGERRIAFAQTPSAVARSVATAGAGVRVVGIRNRPWRFFGSARTIAALARGHLPQGAVQHDGDASAGKTRIAQGIRQHDGDASAQHDGDASASKTRAPQGIRQHDAALCPPQTVVIIGAAEGIGRELARLHYDTAERLVLFDNNRALLEQTVALLQQAGVHDTHHTKAEIVALVGDVRVEADTARIAEHIDRSAAPLRLYITAAVSAVGSFAAIPREALIDVYRINCLPVLRLLRHMMTNADEKQWSVVLFSSLATFIHYPGAACYAGTKAFVSALPFAIGRRVPSGTTGGGGGGTLAVVYPGPIATRHAARYSPDNSHTSSRLSAAAAAARIITELRRGKTMLFLRPSDKIIAIFGIILPRLFGAIMRNALYRKITTPLLPPQD